VPDVPSAQVKSAVLLAGLHARGPTTVVERTPTRDHTERALHAFGVAVTRVNGAVSVGGGQRLHAIDAAIPGDISSAVFWLVLASGTPGSDLFIDGVGLNRSRSSVLDVLRRAGAEIELLVDLPPEGGSYESSEARGGSQRAGEPTGTIHIRYGDPRPFDIAPHEVPGLIDEIPALAALAAMQPDGRMTVRGAGELRVKESDRIAMLARGFGRLGIQVDEYEDGFTIHGGPPAGGEADAAGDHRLAMAFAIAGTRARGVVQITGADAVAVSYPGFFDELERIARAT
jgi:3-phosphoshikimate 1-carboxyvinyltransferase